MNIVYFSYVNKFWWVVWYAFYSYLFIINIIMFYGVKL